MRDKSTKNISLENNDKNLRRQWQKPGETFLHNLQNVSLDVSTSTDTQAFNEESSVTGEVFEQSFSVYDEIHDSCCISLYFGQNLQ